MTEFALFHLRLSFDFSQFDLSFFVYGVLCVPPRIDFKHLWSSEEFSRYCSHAWQFLIRCQTLSIFTLFHPVCFRILTNIRELFSWVQLSYLEAHSFLNNVRPEDNNGNITGEVSPTNEARPFCVFAIIPAGLIEIAHVSTGYLIPINSFRKFFS